MSDELRAEVERLRALLQDPPKHKYWGAGEPDCPPDIKACNGELHTLRCKVCGDENGRRTVCAPQIDATSWQSIATAPRDGRKILLGRFTEPGDKHHGYVAVDWYRQPGSGAGFIGFGAFNKEFWPPTHWMPLPAPPPLTNHMGAKLGGDND